MKTGAALFALGVLVVSLSAPAADRAQPTDSPPAEFVTPTIDLGCVVSDIDASLKFYTEAIGFQAAGGFQVDAPFATASGLTDQKSLDIQVLTLGTGAGATKLKLMQVGSHSKPISNDFIDTTLGFSYITIVVKSTDAALERLQRAGVEPIANGPVTLPANLDPALALTIVRDPDGNFIELVGPKPVK